ncbi:Daunorubicin/doxorubicin resistance ATP-binding protein DrrA [wastewater metagenome]|uniref:Daunorubicin/doxorubicin resistance ATP-binding protein DrrA n=2 Tax=unclassified sequences TaxID=12908 RepID=A0A5B8R8R8_9ZZZZ|nr:ATP-binding cassette domain-containing protein [Arhodomonas sp. KWT]QEA05136.1 daunorubicin/doxorubicin resistance ATP-binding protein DrrA [uncultured organism]
MAHTAVFPTEDAPEAGSGVAAGTPVAVARGLVKRYGDVAVVDGVDLTVERGECLALLGPNGAGKTTTLRLLLGLTPPSAGEIRVLGHAVPEDARAMRAAAGIVPQFDSLDPDFTVRENLLTYGSYFGLSRRRVAGRIDDLLAFAELRERADAPISALSGGMKRRLTLARALVNDPALLVLDEPTTGLDPQARQHIWERLQRLKHDGRTLLLTTHYMEEAERLADRAAVIDGGRIIACDRPRALIAAHIEPHVVELRGDAAAGWRDTAAITAERVGATVLLYSGDRDGLLAAVEAHCDNDYLYRPANLEDVFLRLTGRQVRD